MHYSVCASALFGAQPLTTALEKIRKTGVDTYEIWSWWEGLDLDAVREAQDRLGMKMAALCTRFVPLTDPEQREAYVLGLAETLEAAQKLGCRTVISQVGQKLAHLSREDQHQSIVDGLTACVPLLEEAGATLVIEPLNTLIDHKGYYLYRSDEAFDSVREVGSEHVKVLFDVYHQQIMEGNLILNMTRNVEWIGHVHIAGHPGRHEVLGESEIHYPAVLGALKKAGYHGAVGLEYFPLKDPCAGIAELLEAVPL